MKKISTKKAIIYFYLFDFFLFIAVIAALFIIPKKNSAKTREAVILNTKYLPKINAILIEDLESKEKILLKREGAFWYGVQENAGSKLIFPCNMEELTLILTNLTQLKELTLITESQTFHEYYDISSTKGKNISFMENDKILESITFGKENSLKQTIAFRMNNQEKLYECNFPGETLTTDRSFWCDPYICPLLITGNQEESERSLRRGKLTDINTKKEVSSLITSKKFNLKNGSKVILNFIKDNDTWIVSPEFLAYKEEDQKVFSLFNYSYRISQTTYEGLQK
ncbi:hypothetical protein [Treponema sp.]|uniref:hypothetical protein n=1 Tax=Treponema sp. TaxID=166 RepID=UPI0025CD9FFD|nr:hypothetical protein [Treponema sp.]MCR5217979.1 hypothetical protein [Treponema sp.]